MVNSKIATDFDLLIQEGRQRKRNEELAKEIFGKKRSNDASKRNDLRKSTGSPSLASRIGISKRSSSTSSTLSSRTAPSRPSTAAAQHTRQNRLAKEIHNTQQVNLTTTNSTKPGPGISIKGTAAPFVVEARNFAPGTSEADIASTVKPDCIDANGINSMVSCRIVGTRPTVVAELVFNDRTVADAFIAKYDQRIADGRKLELRLARSGPGSMSKIHKETATAQPSASPVATPALEDDDNAMEDVETDQQDDTNDLYSEDREAAERGRRDRDSRRDKEGYGSSRHRREDGRRVEQQDRRDDEDRDRRGDRDRDRNDRDERTYPREETTNGGRGSHYGNGIGSTTRPQYGGGYAGGRGSYPGYAGYGGRGAGYRSGYRGYR